MLEGLTVNSFKLFIFMPTILITKSTDLCKESEVSLFMIVNFNNDTKYIVISQKKALGYREQQWIK